MTAPLVWVARHGTNASSTSLRVRRETRSAGLDTVYAYDPVLRHLTPLWRNAAGVAPVPRGGDWREMGVELGRLPAWMPVGRRYALVPVGGDLAGGGGGGGGGDPGPAPLCYGVSADVAYIL